MRSPIHRLTPRAATRALALAATVGSVAAVLAPSPAAGAATPACKTSQLVVWLDTQSNGAAGTIFYTLNFTNVGARCTLRGYPGVSAVGRGGKTLGNAAARDSLNKPKTVTLAPPNALHGSFSTAHTMLGIVDTGALPTNTCRPTIASGLRVYPPNQTAAGFVSYPFAACSHSGATYLRVQAITG